MRLAASAAALVLAGCTSLTIEPPPLSRLSGWAHEDHAAALAAYQAGCGVARDQVVLSVCAKARALGPVREDVARVFFETNFRPDPIPAPGLLTAYFAPEYPARERPDGEFSAAIIGPPTDPALATSNRTNIEASRTLQALGWLRAEDLFFLQIQGSGVLHFSDGRRMKASYAGDNGQPFFPIARRVVARGLLAPSAVSAQAIRAWLSVHRGPQAQALMDENPRYVFFKLSPDDGGEPVGSAGLPLTPNRSAAVDPVYHAYGELIWLDASIPTLLGAAASYRGLTVALDTGAAIKGPSRADLYLGKGEQAGLEAGLVHHTLRLVRLVPIEQVVMGKPRDETAAPP